jgi:hypothetical protein
MTIDKASMTELFPPMNKAKGIILHPSSLKKEHIPNFIASNL